MNIDKKRKIELLAPAKNCEIGKAAIDFGADAVYIGAPKYGARSAAGNDIDSIAELVHYAHRYGAKVYVTVNTILYDEELAEVETLIHRLYEVGVDALIVQDMGILEMNLPPIALHASTQCDNRDAGKVKFLQECGFEQVVLARELSLKEIKAIADATEVQLECFVHGALCVCYSGQCYLSESVSHRSANRGGCAQLCRIPYTLVDGEGKVLAENKHLLSLKDFDASSQLAQMIDAGVTSFKIEGRLKEMGYVKNITAYYRGLLDELLQQKGLERSSSGSTHFAFKPNPKKTFYRGSTTYFLADRVGDMSTFDSAKSLGEPIGKVRSTWKNGFELDRIVDLENGDGLCGLNAKGEFIGFRVNKVDGKTIYTHKPVALHRGMSLYRNLDVAFDKLIASDVAKRALEVNLKIGDTANGLCFIMRDETGCEVTLKVECKKELAKNSAKMREVYVQQFSKLGDSMYRMGTVEFMMDDMWFVTMSQLNEWRRELVQLMDAQRDAAYHCTSWKHGKSSHAFPKKAIDYRGNVSNRLARQFYERHHVDVQQMAYELSAPVGVELMRTRYCLKNELGLCPKQKPADRVVEPLELRMHDKSLMLEFDCKHCEMMVKRKDE